MVTHSHIQIAVVVVSAPVVKQRHGMPYTLDLVLGLRGALASGEGEVGFGVAGTLPAIAIR
jgi:hypothetical protein